jgi:hypothetical protein
MSFFNDAIIDEFLQILNMPNLTIKTHRNIDIEDFKSGASMVCRGLILKSYINRTFKNLTSHPELFEMAILYETVDLDTPISFIIVEKGECARMPDAWSINLICAIEQTSSGLKSCGQFLNGLYLYTIAKNPFVLDKRGVLELANSFINAAGLASYSKLGFVIDESMYGETCFPNVNNLPMITPEINPIRIIQILLGFPDAPYPKPVICNFRGPIQLYLGVSLNLLTFLRNVPVENLSEYIDDPYEMNDKRIVNYKYLFDSIQGDIPGFEKLIINVQKGAVTDSAVLPCFAELETVLVTKKRRGATDSVVKLPTITQDVGRSLRPRAANPLVSVGKSKKQNRGGKTRTRKTVKRRK